MDSLLDEMSIEDVSFYGDDDDGTRFQRLQIEAQQTSCIAALAAAESTNYFYTAAELEQGIEASSASHSTPSDSFSTESMDMSMDDEDGYMDMLELEALQQQEEQFALELPTDLNALISGHIKGHTPAKQNHVASVPARPSVRRCLYLSPDRQKHYPSERVLNANEQSPAFKRPVSPSVHTGSTPLQVKRLRRCEKENFNQTSCTAAPHIAGSPCLKSVRPTVPPPLRKSMSLNDADVLSALTRTEHTLESELIGDFSRAHLLPLVKGKHSDLKSISSDTLAGVINGAYGDALESYQIIDCRYPYEYLGGHIVGSKNLYTQAQIIDEFLNKNRPSSMAQTPMAQLHRKILIFHCEFSTERAPKLLRFLRSNDRLRNTNAYPALNYPEIYLLHNGYKDFFETHKELCDPAAYRPMLEPAYNEAYRHFRAKSKSWNGTDAHGNLCDTNAIAAATRKKLNVLQRRALNFRF